MERAIGSGWTAMKCVFIIIKHFKLIDLTIFGIFGKLTLLCRVLCALRKIAYFEANILESFRKWPKLDIHTKLLAKYLIVYLWKWRILEAHSQKCERVSVQSSKKSQFFNKTPSPKAKSILSISRILIICFWIYYNYKGISKPFSNGDGASLTSLEMGKGVIHLQFTGLVLVFFFLPHTHAAHTQQLNCKRAHVSGVAYHSSKDLFKSHAKNGFLSLCALCSASLIELAYLSES